MGFDTQTRGKSGCRFKPLREWRAAMVWARVELSARRAPVCSGGLRPPPASRSPLQRMPRAALPGRLPGHLHPLRTPAEGAVGGSDLRDISALRSVLAYEVRACCVRRIGDERPSTLNPPQAGGPTSGGDLGQGAEAGVGASGGELWLGIVESRAPVLI